MISQENFEKLEKELEDELGKEFAQNQSVRPTDAPFTVTYNGYIFKFVKYMIKEKMFKYVCENGYNKHKPKELRCKASILVPLLIIREKIDKIPIKIINEEHTCTKKTGYLDEFIKVTELKQKIEDIYYSKTPRPTKANLLIQLLQIYKSPIPEGIVNSHYSLLEKKKTKKTILISKRYSKPKKEQDLNYLNTDFMTKIHQ